MSQRFGVAIVGTGFVGRIHARAARLAGARLVGVAASSPASGTRAAAELGADRAFATAEEAATADGVDVVHVCTPNHLHEELARRALAAGKHVVCEKPVAMDAAGASRVAAAATEANRLVSVPFVYRFHPIVRQARSLVCDGTVGPVRLVHGSYQQDWLAGADDTNWRVDAALSGASRAFADIGSHWCDLVEFVTGHRIARLVARTATFVPDRPAAGRETFSGAGGAGGTGPREAVDTEDAAVVLFETDAGAYGSVVVSQASPGRKNRLWFEVDGADAAVAFDQEDAERLWVGRRQANTVSFRDPAENAPDSARLSYLPAGHAQGYADCFEAFVRDTYAAIETGTRPEGLPVVADGVRTALIVEAVIDSATRGTWVDVTPPPADEPASPTKEAIA
jgi:predicted dehydrogenase